MGLTIHWTFKAVGTRQKARAIVDGLRHAAMDLPFKEVDEVIELAGAACKVSKYDEEILCATRSKTGGDGLNTTSRRSPLEEGSRASNSTQPT